MIKTLHFLRGRFKTDSRKKSPSKTRETPAGPSPGSCGSPRPPRQRRRLNRLGGLFGAPWAHNKITMPQYWLVSVPLDQDAVRAASSGAGGANRTWEDLQNRTSRQDLCEASRVRINHPARRRSLKPAQSCVLFVCHGNGSHEPHIYFCRRSVLRRAPRLAGNWPHLVEEISRCRVTPPIL